MFLKRSFVRIVGTAQVMEFVELSLDAFGVGGAALVLVQLQCLPPHCPGLIVLSEGRRRVTDVVEGVRDPVGVAVVAAQGEGLVVVVEALLVVAGAVGDESEAVQGGCLTVVVVMASVQGEGGVAVVAGGVELAQASGVPAPG